MTSARDTPGRLRGRRVFLWTALAVGLGAVIPTAWLIVPRGVPLAPTVVWIALAGGITAMAVHGARGFRRARTGQLRAERERMLALERLAASERRRIETEHLASVGRLAGQIAHELSNPLAVVKANLRWLEAAPPGEAAEVLSETNESVRRITGIVDEMRALAGETSEPVPVAPALHLAGSLDVSLAAEFAAQGNGYLEPIEIAGAHGFSARVPAAPVPRVTPAPVPAVAALK